MEQRGVTWRFTENKNMAEWAKKRFEDPPPKAATTAAARFCSRAADFSGVEAFLDGVVAGGADDGDFGVIVRGGGEEDESIRAQGFE